jgi:hypothetical protein
MKKARKGIPRRNLLQAVTTDYALYLSQRRQFFT